MTGLTVVDVVRERLEGRDPVEFWLGRISPRARGGSKSSLVGFLRWLTLRPEWLGVDPRALLLRQAAANDSYALLELLQEYVNGREDLCANSKAFMYNAVRSFFLHNRLPLPSDRAYRIRASKTPVVSRLTLENVADMARNASLRDRSIILVKWQSLLDNARTMWIGEQGAEQIVKQIQGKIHPVRLDLAGRKMGLNTRPFFTFIGKDAVDALVEYFEKERGWPEVWRTYLAKENIEWRRKRKGSHLHGLRPNVDKTTAQNRFDSEATRQRRNDTIWLQSS